MKPTNYTQVSNEFIEEMNKYDGAEVKVFLAITRKTIGWHKTSDKISYAQLKLLTGLSINSLKKAIDTLIKDQWIIQESTKNGFKYDLDIIPTVSITDTVEKPTVSITDTGVSITDTELCQSLTPTLLKENKETKEKESDSLSQETLLSKEDQELLSIDNLKHRWKVLAIALNLSNNVDIDDISVSNCLADPLFDFDKITIAIQNSKRLRGIGKGNSKTNAVTFQSIINDANFRQQIMDGVFSDANQAIPVLFKDSPQHDYENFKSEIINHPTFLKRYKGADVEYYYDELKSWAKKTCKKSGDWVEEGLNFMRLDVEGTGLKTGGGKVPQLQIKVRDGYGQD